MKRTLVKEILSASFLLVLGIAGLIHIQVGAWRAAPLVPSYIMPQTAYYFLLVAAAWLLATLGFHALRGRLSALVPSGAKDQDLTAIAVAVSLMIGGAIIYFLMVLNIGLVVSTVLFNALLISVLAPNSSLKALLLVPPAVGAVVWLLFIKMIGMTLPPSLLF